MAEEPTTEVGAGPEEDFLPKRSKSGLRFNPDRRRAMTIRAENLDELSALYSEDATHVEIDADHHLAQSWEPHNSPLEGLDHAIPAEHVIETPDLALTPRNLNPEAVEVSSDTPPATNVRFDAQETNPSEMSLGAAHVEQQSGHQVSPTPTLEESAPVQEMQEPVQEITNDHDESYKKPGAERVPEQVAPQEMPQEVAPVAVASNRVQFAEPDVNLVIQGVPSDTRQPTSHVSFPDEVADQQLSRAERRKTRRSMAPSAFAALNMDVLLASGEVEQIRTAPHPAPMTPAEDNFHPLAPSTNLQWGMDVMKTDFASLHSMSAPVSPLQSSAPPTASSSNSTPTPTPVRLQSSAPPASPAKDSTRPASASHAPSTPTKAPQTYADYLEIAKNTDFDDIRKAQFAYQSGLDFAGRPVVVCCGAMPPDSSPDDLFLYIIDLLDPIAESDYSVVYVVMSEGKKPSFSWMRKVYGTISRKYKKNLKQLFIVNPTFWVKAGFQFFRPFISTKFWRKVVYVNDLRQIYQYMSPTQVRLPAYVMQQAGFKNTCAVFGQPLDMVLAHPMNHGREIPYLVDSACDAILKHGLQTEGIFRLSGNTTRIKHIQDSFDKGTPIDLAHEEDIHNVTGILKKFLREMPEPLLPFSIFPSLMTVASDDDTPAEARLALIQSLFCDIERSSFLVLDRLLSLLVRIASFERVNKMGAANLAIVVAPNILYCENDTPLTAMANASAVNSVVKLMITNSEHLLGPARQKHETSSHSAAPSTSRK